MLQFRFYCESINLCQQFDLKACKVSILTRFVYMNARFQLQMAEPGDRDVIIGRGDGEEESCSGFQGLRFDIGGGSSSSGGKSRTKSFHPPIETHWDLNSAAGKKTSSPIKSLLSYPLMKFRKTKSLIMILEGARDPKDKQIVESFRQMLLREGLLPPKHNDYHTLLRYVCMYVSCCKSMTSLIAELIF